MSALVPIAVLLPLLGAALSLALSRYPVAQRRLSLGVLAAMVVVSAVLLREIDAGGPITIWVGAWPEPLGIVLVADRLAVLMLLVSSVVTTAVMAYSIGQGMVDDEESAPVAVYHP